MQAFLAFLLYFNKLNTPLPIILVNRENGFFIYAFMV
jgi:hypothetical protein